MGKMDVATSKGATESSMDIDAIARCQFVIDDIITELGMDPQDLTAFCFELRCLDKDDLFTRQLLEKNVRPSIMVDMILSNKWNPKSKQMETNPEKMFNISIGTGRYKSNGKALLFRNKKGWGNPKPHQPIAMPKDILHTLAEWNSNFQFRLFRNGFKIIDGPQGVYCLNLPELDEEPEPGKSFDLYCTSSASSHSKDSVANYFTFIPFNRRQDVPQFFLE